LKKKTATEKLETILEREFNFIMIS
jgi:hypothetical protein